MIKTWLKKLWYVSEPALRVHEPALQEQEPPQILFAREYLGWNENENRTQLKKLLGMDPVTDSWCAAFVNAIEKKCDRKGSGSLAARSFLKYGKAVLGPQKGDIVVFWRGSKNSWQGHVGYYMDEDEDGIRVLGGNQGDSVCFKRYPKARLLGFRRP